MEELIARRNILTKSKLSAKYREDKLEDIIKNKKYAYLGYTPEKIPTKIESEETEYITLESTSTSTEIPQELKDLIDYKDLEEKEETITKKQNHQQQDPYKNKDIKDFKELEDLDKCPFLCDEVIENIAREEGEHKIYNKKNKDNGLLFKFYNSLFPEELIYCFNYPNKDFKYVDNNYNLFYFASNAPIFLTGIKPFTFLQHYILLDNIAYTIETF
jgi:hypothetical protein